MGSLRYLLAVLALALSPLNSAQSAPPLERGAAITDPLALRELDRGLFGLARMLSASSGEPLTDSALFALPAVASIRKSLDDEFERYIERHKSRLANETIGVGPQFDFQLFDREQLYSQATRFVLAGIVNRMDRAFVAPDSCGEIRLIYRLTQIDAPPVGDHGASARLPMTLNLVLKARADGSAAALTCATIARRWLDTGNAPLTGAALADRLRAPDGPLASIGPGNIERIETNLQIVHVAQSPQHEFRTDYLLKVFDYDRKANVFEEATLEDQIDRERLLSDEKLKGEFKAWLLDPSHLAEFDRGTVLIPQEFLAKAAIAPIPIGFSASPSQPSFGLMQGEGDNPVFSNAEVVTALQKAAARGIKLQNIRSVAGFARRLNDITCAGCHQTRGIGGFHFPGVDWMAQNPNNATIVPASPHFFGDQVRRREILTEIQDGKAVDFSRGFSERPQLRGSHELAGTEYDDGWGAHCYGARPKAADNDKSYTAWGCAKGLSCQVMSEASRMGMCFVGNR
ncbi:MAG TPA: hypothetical protein VFL62_00300 [Bradyrhizobium sp.]|uniref:hypothetical protein n=1 Tax=Bradyrhizobium sp. TaxID=376 RepID=UPI002D80A5EC|nr:hypothetical protein [Bradyrhizobium sp.]HET7884638.1 hypothetical protein [Bradyrhizobium sp.]